MLLVNYNDKVLGGTTCKGNQMKWRNGDFWYKADFLGYEGMAEYVASLLLSCSTLDPDEYVFYAPCTFEEVSREYSGSLSKSYIRDELFEIPIGRYVGVDPDKDPRSNLVECLQDIKDYFHFDATDYFRKLFTLDAIILNEDRHMNNMILVATRNHPAVIRGMIFDYGLSLLSDTREYPSIEHMCRVKAKPFSRDFSEQYNLLGPGFTIDTSALLFKLRNIDHRAKDVLLRQIPKFPEIFK